MGYQYNSDGSVSCTGDADPSRMGSYAGPANTPAQIAYITAFFASEPAPVIDPNSLPGAVSRISLLELTQLAVSKGPFTVQDGGSNPLSAFSTTNLRPGVIVGISDMGGCGAGGTNGFGLAMWGGAQWYRVSRGTQAVMAPAATLNLDYWKSPMLVSLTGSTQLTTRILIANAPNGARYSITKPGITSLLSAFSINMLGGTPATDIAIIGPNAGLFEVANSLLNQVFTY